MNLYPILKPFLFQQNAEDAHHWAFWAMGIANGALLNVIAPPAKLIRQTGVDIAGIHFKNRVGLAAGFDKNALRLQAWKTLGFGHVEIGTVTPRPQPGNPQPRLFRLVEDGALINRMGFNNDGAAAIRKRLDNRPASVDLIVGGNIGKNKDTSEEDAYKDYILCLNALHDAVDYITINISSPNTQGLRNLQSREPLLKLLSEVQNRNQGLPKPRPIFVKIAPDLELFQLEDIVHIVAATHMAGLVATNTTLSRNGLHTTKDQVAEIGQGGLSGAPLTQPSQEITRQLSHILPKNLALIGSGGIMSSIDATERITAGAQLVQLYTGFVYSGPQLVVEVLKATR